MQHYMDQHRDEVARLRRQLRWMAATNSVLILACMALMAVIGWREMYYR